MTTHTLQRVAAYGALIVAFTIIVASVWSYPSWMWFPLVLGMLAGGATATVSIGELLRRRVAASR